jgi:hypothetical protein
MAKTTTITSTITKPAVYSAVGGNLRVVTPGYSKVVYHGGTSGYNNYIEQQRQQEAAAQAAAQAEASAKASALAEQQRKASEAAAKAAAEAEEKKRVFYAREKTSLNQGQVVVNQNQFKPKDYNPSTDVVVYTRGSYATGRGAGNVVVEKGTYVVGKQGDVVAKEIKKLNVQQPVIKNTNTDTTTIKELQASDAKVGFFDQKRYDASRQTEKGKFSFKTQLLGIGAGAASSIGSTLSFGKSLFTEPVTTIKSVGTGLKNVGLRIKSGEFFPEIGNVLKNEPSFAIGYAAAEYGQAKVGGVVLDKSIETTKLVGTRLSPKFKPVVKVDDALVIKNIPSSVAGRNTIDIPIAGSLKDIEVPIPKQVKIAGTNIDAVSAQRSLFGMFDDTKVINKPLPTPDSPPLERAFFADPYGKLRVSRLGVLEEAPQRASFLDVLSGNVQFSKTKPQVTLFENVPVEKFPASLKDVEKLLKKGKSGTEAQKLRLVEWQLKPSGKFKPLGFISTEPEVILSPGEIIRKQKTIAKTIFNSKPIDIFSVEIASATPKTAELQKLKLFGGLNLKQNAELISRISKETGFSSRQINPKPYLSPYPGITGAAITTSKAYSPSTKTSSASYKVVSTPSYLLPASSPIKLSAPAYSPARGYGGIKPSGYKSVTQPLPRAFSASPAYRPPKQTNYPRQPSKTPSYRYPTPGQPRPRVPVKNPPFTFKLPKSEYEGKGKGLFGVEVRRFGKFRNIGFGDLGKVQSIGQSKVSRTLGATYRITGKGIPGIKIPKGFYGKKTKSGLEIIEMPKFRLSTTGEKLEIAGFGRIKRRSK